MVIAMDNSMSMGLTDGGASRFDNARKAAEQVVDALPGGSEAALLVYSDVDRPVIAEPASDLNLVRRMIREAALTDRGSNVHPALREALDIFKRHAVDGGEVFLITDAQATGWKEMAAMRNEVTLAGARVEIVVPGPGEQPNLGVSDLELGSPMAPVGAAVRFSVGGDQLRQGRGAQRDGRLEHRWRRAERPGRDRIDPCRARAGASRSLEN